ncbi:peptide methionine sulfoxide reductase MsrA [Lipomyces arxii]|uniref:peptide methionine sulfoxide reductase MsrA n=1 Tax=Lipomyces arxii TaxID=56418 RepID=UPI0034CE901D
MLMASFFQLLVKPLRSTSIMPVTPAGITSAGPISATLTVPEGTEVATVAAGCFWGVEHIYRQYFGNGKGLLDARVGYSGGSKENPTYKEVCGADTGHAESLQILFDPKIVSYDTLIDFFFRMHDPTTMNRQGPDRGPQYRSAIFYHSDEQKKTAEEVKQRLQKNFYTEKIVTELIPIGVFWDAEQYHQLYLDKNPYGYECPTHFLRTTPMSK